jgi:hypothetical protein
VEIGFNGFDDDGWKHTVQAGSFFMSNGVTVLFQHHCLEDAIAIKFLEYGSVLLQQNR